MKVALAQINPTVGDFEYNSNKIMDYINQAAENNADIVIFPELSICGYPPKDLLLYPQFIKNNLATVEQIINNSPKEIIVVLGYVEPNKSPKGKDLYNAAVVFKNNKIVSKHYKTLLPTYDVFDESRYFEPSDNITTCKLDRHNIGVSICEDCWNDADFWPRRLYDVDPIEEIAKQNADFIINIGASPYYKGKFNAKLEMYRHICKKHNKSLISVNQVGGNDELMFDGRSIVMTPKGELVALGKAFEEDLIIIDDICDVNKKIEYVPKNKNENLLKALVLGIKDYVTKCGFSKVAIGLSGGIDSALVATLAVKALGKENVLGLGMPSQYSSEGSVTDAQKLAENLGIEMKIVPIKEIFNKYQDVLSEHFEGRPNDVTEENIQARIRGNYLMAFSNKFGYLILSTGNKSELAVGYSTLYGDMCGGLSPINDLLKTTVYDLCKYINRNEVIIPENTITKEPSAELRPDQKDKDSLPPYEILDGILKSYIEKMYTVEEIVKKGYDKNLVLDIIGKINRNEYKRRQAPPGLKVSPIAFGIGRRLPIAYRWNYKG